MTLATWYADRFTTIQGALGWSDFSVITEDALELYGVATEEEATDTEKLHALARFALWKQAQIDVSLDMDFSADGRSFSRSQMHKMITENLARAMADATHYLDALQIDVTQITIRDPYDYDEDRDNAGNF